MKFKNNNLERNATALEIVAVQDPLNHRIPQEITSDL
jgi:hypothetical protein